MDSIKTNYNAVNTNMTSGKPVAVKQETSPRVSDGYVKQEDYYWDDLPDVSKAKKSFLSEDTKNTIVFLTAIAGLTAVAGGIGAGIGAGMALLVGGSAAKGAAIFGGVAAVGFPISVPFLIGKLISPGQ